MVTYVELHIVGSIRSAIEKLARGRTIKRKLSVSGTTTQLYASPDSQLKYLKLGSRAFDSDLIEIAECCLRSASVVWDVGANVGVFTFAAACVAAEGTVVAIEADIWLASLLRKSHRLRSNRTKDIRVVPVAVSDSDSIAAFLIAARGRASNALEEAGGNSQMGGVREKQYVPTLRLDTILETMPKPDFLKIDVEGAEFMVIKGAQRLLETARPIIYMEVNEQNSDKVFRILKEWDYIAFSSHGEPLPDAIHFNSFFIPKQNDYALALMGKIRTKYEQQS